MLRILFLFIGFIRCHDPNIIITNQISMVEKIINEINYEDLVILDLFNTFISYEYDIFNKENKKKCINALNYKLCDINRQKSLIKEGESRFKVEQNFLKLVKKMFNKDIKILALLDKKNYKNPIFRTSSDLGIQDKQYIEGIFYYSNIFKFDKVPSRLYSQYKRIVLISSNPKQISAFVSFCRMNKINYLVVYFAHFSIKKDQKYIDNAVSKFLKKMDL